MSRVHGPVNQAMDLDWWLGAGMVDFVPAATSYASGPSPEPGRLVERIAIGDVEPLVRRLSHGVFNDNDEIGTARHRVVEILRGFKVGRAIPPVLVDRLEEPERFVYRLRDGAHRFYCSVAAGFTHVPAIIYEPAEWTRT